MSRNELRLRLLELERRISHLQLIQTLQGETIESQGRTVDKLHDMVLHLLTRKRSA